MIFDVILQINEDILNIRFMLKGIEPSELGEMINEDNVKTMTIDRFN